MAQKNPYAGLFDTNKPIVKQPKEQNPYSRIFGGGRISSEELQNIVLESQPKARIEQPKPIFEQHKISAPSGAPAIQAPPKKESFLIRVAKTLLPKSLEDYFGLNKSEESKRIAEAYEQIYARADLKRLQKRITAGGGKLPIKTAGEEFRETKAEELVPFFSAIPSVINAVQLYQSVKRFEAGTNTAVDDFRLTKAAAEAQRDKTFPAKVINVLKMLPSFGGELLATGGIFSFVKKGTEKTITKIAAKKLGEKATSLVAKTLGTVAGATARTIPARFGEITAGTIQNMTPGYNFYENEAEEFSIFLSKDDKGDSVWRAATLSLGDQWVEVLSESSGGIFNLMGASIKSKLLKIGLFNSFRKANPSATTKEFMKWVRRAGWNGTLAEIGEERVGEVLRGGLTVIGLSEEGYKLPTKEQLAVELVSFTIPGVTIAASQKLLDSQEQGQAPPPVKGQPPVIRAITEAENVTGARDLLIVGRGGRDLDTDETAGLTKIVTEYNNEMANPVIEILELDNSTLAQIQTVQYPDGKWTFSYEINTPEGGIFSDFLTNKLYTTREKAVAQAKADVLEHANSELENVSEENLSDFENIITQFERVEPTSEIPIEVRKEERDLEEDVEEEGKIVKKKIIIKNPRDAAKDLIKGYVKRGDSLASLRAGGLGFVSPTGYSASIGGFVNGKKIGSDKIIVEQIDGVKLEKPVILSLEEIYNEIKEGAPKKKVEKKPEEKKEEKTLLRQRFEKWAKEQGAKKILTYTDGEPYFVVGGVEVSLSDYLSKEEPKKEEKPEEKEEKPAVAKEIPTIGEAEMKVANRVSPTKIFDGHPIEVKDKPKIYTDGFMLLEDRTPEEVTKWREEILKRGIKEKRDVGYNEIKQIYPKENGKKFSEKIIAQEMMEGRPVAYFDIGNGELMAINLEAYNWIKKQKYEFFQTGITSPIILKRNNKKVGLLMPIKVEASTKDIYRQIKKVEKKEEPKPEEKPKEEEARKFKTAEEFVKNELGTANFDEMISFQNSFENKLKLDRALEAYGVIVQPQNVYKASEKFTARQLRGLSKWYEQRLKAKSNPAMTMVKGLLDIDIIPKKIFTKQQLTDIFNKAQEKPKPKKKITDEEQAEKTLPRELAGAKPRYGFGLRLFTLEFKSDVDKALYIVAKSVPSKADAQYVSFLKGVYPDVSTQELRSKGAIVRSVIKELARDSEAGNLVIEKITEVKKETKKKAPRFAKVKPEVKKLIVKKGEPRFAKAKPEEVEEKMLKNIRGYRTFGGVGVGTETQDPYLRDLYQLSKTKTGKKLTDDAIKKAIELGELEVTKNGNIVVYRSGELSDKNELASITYDRIEAENFDHTGQAKIWKFKIKPSNISIYIGGKESEILMPASEIAEAIKTAPEIQKQAVEPTEVEEVDIDKEGTLKAPSGFASAGAQSIGTFENLKEAEITPKDFKLFEEVKKLIEKYAQSIGEDYTPRGALGVYYPQTGNIRIKGMNDISVAAHEITHFLDFAYNITKKIGTETGNSEIRRELTEVYIRYYPGGKKTHKLSKRVIEGFATLLQKYVEQPTKIQAEFPNTVKQFFTPEGKYHEPIINDILKDLRELISKFQGLPALDKIGARVVDNKVNVNKESFLNFFQKFKTEVADNIYPIEVLAKRAKVHFTKQDPSLWVRQYNNSNAVILNNINGNRGFWGWRNGEMEKLQDFNWKDLITELQDEKVSNEFGFWLVARREHFAYQDLERLKERATKLSVEAKEAREEAQKTGEDPNKGAPALLTRQADEAKKLYLESKQILDNDGFTKQEVDEAYLLNKEKFEGFAEKYDILVREDLNFLHDPEVGLINDTEYDKLQSKTGYASFKRYFYDEIVGEDVGSSLGRVRFGNAKVSSLLKRTGSKKPIVNPLFSSLTNHAEITRKGLKQIVSNRIGELAPKFPDLFQAVELQAIPDNKGRLIYPQDRDPNIMMARINYKRKPFIVDTTIKRTVDEVLNFQNLSIFEQLLTGSSRFFTKGTTGLFPGFAITNYTIDQIAAVAQTRNKYIPLYDPIKRLWGILDSENPHHRYLQEYLVMGGERQTFVGWQDMTPNELFGAIGKEKVGILKVIDHINAGMSILAIPSQWSEIATRATEFIKAREAGKTQIVALEEAGRVTAPFHHVGRLGGGRIGATFIKSIPFFNPAIQVLAQTAETLETAQGRKQFAFVTLAISAASISALGLLMTAGTDDQKSLYADLHPDELVKYIWLPNPDGKSLIKIRVPDQMAVFATLVNMMATDKILNANYSAGEYLNAGLAWLPQQANITEPARMFMSWIPQLLKPGVLTIAGVKDFPKIIPLESRSLQSRAPGFRYNQATSPVAKWLGKTLNFSPIKIDYLLTGYAGRATGFLTGKPGIYNPLKSLNRKYYFTSGRRVQSFYDLKQKNDEDYESWRNKRKDFSFLQKSAMLKQRAKLKLIESNITLFRDIDEETDPQKADEFRVKILKLIDKL